ncbi:hypothetical protein D6833_02725 [Candidatus Parcubacteria bacterium]|nr:MAG: hypothetical protein D6833_02725 [Candidatus Parcubacteria bacterium]
MKKSNLFWVFLVGGLLGWPAVETFRYVEALNQLADSEQLAGDVALKLAQTRAVNSQVAHHTTASAPKPE